MKKKAMVEFLKKVTVFKGLSEEQLAKIEQVLQEQSVKKGEIIIQENTPGHEMFILAEGRVEVSHSLTLKTGRNTFADKDKSLNFLDARNFCCFGEIAMIDNTETRTATVTTLTDCLLYMIERKDFERICEEDSKLGYVLVRNIAQGICSRLKKSNNDLLKLTTALSIALNR